MDNFETQQVILDSDMVKKAKELKKFVALNAATHAAKYTTKKHYAVLAEKDAYLDDK